MHDFWVVVADSARARFLHGRSPNSELEEFQKMTNEAARQDELDLVTDKPGRFRDDTGARSGSGRSSTEPTARDQVKEDFAKRVASYLDRARADDRFSDLSVVAEPSFLGRLRNSLDGQTREAILEEINKNLAGADSETIRETLTRLPSGFK
ncbi:MAG: host attachment protein [Bradymonadaceae bacterium]